MKSKRKFSKDFKRQVVEELVSETASLAQLSRRHNISSGLIVGWRKQYAEGNFSDDTENIKALKARIEQLEKLIGRMALDNDLLKKAAQYEMRKKSKNSSEIISGSLVESDEGVR